MADILTDADIDDQPISRAEELINMLLDDSLADIEFAELSTLISESDDVRQLYVDMATLHAELVDHFRPVPEPAAPEAGKPKSPVLGFLGDSSQLVLNSRADRLGN